MTTINVLFIRHGERTRTEPEEDAPLTAYGQEQVRSLARQLAALGVTPSCCLVSSHAHARETARLLLDGLSVSSIPLHDSDILRPKSCTFGVTELVAEAEKADARFDQDAVLMLIGHENRLSQLISRMTHLRFRPLERAEVACVSAESREALLSGRATLGWRIPVRAYQEEDLRDKIGSKMTVTAILTGFNVAALVELTTNEKLAGMSGLGIAFTDHASALHCLAILLLICASALFLSAAYIYDRLAMPEGFWVASTSGSWRRLPSSIRKNMKEGYGVIYSHMVHTWNWFFTPGVVLSALGLLCLVAKKTSFEFAGVCAIVLLVVAKYYSWLKPKLGVD